MKYNFINDLKQYLLNKRITEEQVEDIISDYNELYSEYQSLGLSDDDIKDKLGSVRSIYLLLKPTLNKKEDNWKSKVVALSPFVSLIAFVLIGYFTKVWHPTWLIFLLIPLSSVVLYGSYATRRLLLSSPFIATAIFLTIGFYLGVWHPTWLIFMIIPVLGVFSSHKKTFLNKVLDSLLFIGLTTAILLPYFDIISWTYSWLFILTFIILSPIKDFNKNNKSNNFKNIMTSTTLLIAIILYIIIVYTTGEVTLALLSFILPFITGIWSGHIIFQIDLGKGREFVLLSIISVLSIVTFIVLGIIYSNWAYIWQVLLLIPIAASIILPDDQKSRLLSVVTFLSIIIFYSIGYFYSAWAVSWLAFLLIPITSILQGKKVIKIDIKNNKED